MIKRLLNLCVVLGIVNYCFAQEPMDYRACIDYALENNLALKGFNFRIQKQEANTLSAYGNMLPTINGYSSLNISQGRTTDPNTNQIIDADPFLSNNYGVSSSITLFNGFRGQNQLKYEKYMLLAFNEDYEKQTNDITYLILDAYIQYLINLGLSEIQLEQLEASQKEVYRIKKQIELGLSSGSDLYEAEAQMATDEFLLIQNQNASYSSENSLKKLLNFPIDSALEIADIEMDTEQLTMVSEDSLTLVNPYLLPEVKSTMALLEASKKQFSIAKGSLSPGLSAYGNWGSGYLGTRKDSEGNLISYGEQINLNSRIGYGLSLNIPIFYRLSRRNTIQQSMISLQEAENEMQTVLRDTEYLINEALLDYNGAIAEFQSAKKREQSMELAFEVIEKKREKGLVSIMEFYQAKNNLAIAKGQNLRTKLQLFVTEKIIHFYLTGSFLN
ncbi:unnamed protein product [Chrysoparadoxa australica]